MMNDLLQQKVYPEYVYMRKNIGQGLQHTLKTKPACAPSVRAIQTSLLDWLCQMRPHGEEKKESYSYAPRAPKLHAVISLSAHCGEAERKTRIRKIRVKQFCSCMDTASRV